MQRSIVSSPNRALSQLCRTCRRAQIANHERIRALSTSSRRRPSASVQQQQTAPRETAPRQQLPRSAIFARNASTSTAHGEEAHEPVAQPQETRPPRFYALFPETLPAGPPPSGPFHIDVRALRREFLRLQATVHPDFHHAASGPSQTQAASLARAEATSALINDAYKTLSSPLMRAQYLLREVHGADLAGDEAGSVAEADPDLLMLVMDAREAIEEAETDEDIAQLRNLNENRIKASVDGLERAFREDDIPAAKAEAIRLRYWENIKESLHNWESGKPVVLQH